MLPTFVAAGVLTVSAAVVAWFHPYIRYGIYGCWVVLLGVWAYRAVTFTYRLTNRRLLCDRGLRHPAAGEIAVNRITAVRVERRWWQGVLGVGRLRVEGVEGDAPLLLEGVYRPEQVAGLILHAAGRPGHGRTGAGCASAPPRH